MVEPKVMDVERFREYLDSVQKSSVAALEKAYNHLQYVLKFRAQFEKDNPPKELTCLVWDHLPDWDGQAGELLKAITGGVANPFNPTKEEVEKILRDRRKRAPSRKSPKPSTAAK